MLTELPFNFHVPGIEGELFETGNDGAVVPAQISFTVVKVGVILGLTVTEYVPFETQLPPEEVNVYVETTGAFVIFVFTIEEGDQFPEIVGELVGEGKLGASSPEHNTDELDAKVGVIDGLTVTVTEFDATDGAHPGLVAVTK